DVRDGATLAGAIRSTPMFGNSSGSGNGINGVRFNAQDAGTMGFLLMSGPNAFNNNVIGDGVNFDAVGVDMAVAQVTGSANGNGARSEEHTSELQSRENLVCRLLLE